MRPAAASGPIPQGWRGASTELPVCHRPIDTHMRPPACLLRTLDKHLTMSAADMRPAVCKQTWPIRPKRPLQVVKQPKLEIKKDAKGMVTVPGATVVEVTSAKQLWAVIEAGQKNRHVAATQVHTPACSGCTSWAVHPL